MEPAFFPGERERERDSTLRRVGSAGSYSADEADASVAENGGARGDDVLRSKILLKVRGKGASGRIQINYLSGEQSGRAGGRIDGTGTENFGPPGVDLHS